MVQKSLSGRCFKNNNKTIFSKNVGYIRFSLVDKHYRNKGIGQKILKGIINELRQSRPINKLVVTMGADNGSNIRRWIKSGGYLIGIIQLVRIFGFNYR